jgi:hypothetical protein
LLDLIKEHIDHVESGAEDSVKEALRYFANTKAAVKHKQQDNARYAEINIDTI